MGVEDLLHGALGWYVAAPQWIKTAAGSAYRALPLGLRRGQVYAGTLSELQQRRDEAQQRAAAEARLRAALQWAVASVPAYRAFEGIDLGDPAAALRRFPLVSKADLKRDLPRYVSSAGSAAQRLRTFTGGSTAEPMEFYLQRHVTRAREYAYMDEFHRRAGLGDDDLVLALRGRTVPGAGCRGERLWMLDPIKRQLILSTDHLEPRWLPQYVQALRRWRPAFIQAFPSALYPLVRWLQAHPAPEVTERIRGVMLYSENVYDFQMQAFRDLFRCPVLLHYGHSERVLMAASMPDDERFFFWPQYGWLELLDADGRAVERPGELGEIVGTAFDNRAMAFIRYRTGDMAVASDRPHPELPGFAAVERIEGRLQEFVVCRDGRLVSIVTMGAAHFERLAPVQETQFEQDRPGELTLKVVAREPLAEDAKTAIARAVERKTQGGCSARVVEVETIARTPRGKHVMLVQHLALDRYWGAARGSA